GRGALGEAPRHAAALTVSGFSFLVPGRGCLERGTRNQEPATFPLGRRHLVLSGRGSRRERLDGVGASRPPEGAPGPLRRRRRPPEPLARGPRAAPDDPRQRVPLLGGAQRDRAGTRALLRGGA